MYHFSYYTSILEEFAKNEEIDLTIMFSRKWSNNCPSDSFDEFTTKYTNVKVDWIPSVNSKARENAILVFRELKTYLSYCTRSGQSAFYKNRWNNYIPKLLRKLVNMPILHDILKLAYRAGLFSQVENILPPDENSLNYLIKNKPDIIYSSPVNLRLSDLTEILKSGKRLNIPLVYSVLSWDNLTTKGLFHIKPNKLLVWNEEHFKEAISVHGFNKKQIAIIGSPFFDKWFESDPINPSLDSPSCPYILYLGSSGNIAKDESWVVEKLSKFIEESDLPQIKDLTILVKPHPANSKPFERLSSFPAIKLWPDNCNLPETHKARMSFYNAVKGSIFCLGINTSAMIDVAIMKKLCFALMIEQYSSTQQNAMHFQHLLNYNAVVSVETIEGLFDAYLNNINDLSSMNSYAQNAFVRKFIRPRGLSRSAGANAADIILSMLN